MYREVHLTYYSYSEYTNDIDRFNYLEKHGIKIGKTFDSDDDNRFQLKLKYYLSNNYYLFYKLKYE